MKNTKISDIPMAIAPFLKSTQKQQNEHWGAFSKNAIFGPFLHKKCNEQKRLYKITSKIVLTMEKIYSIDDSVVLIFCLNKKNFSMHRQWIKSK